MQILNLSPDQDGYQLQEPSDRVLRARLAGGATRSRLDQAESWKEANVNWTVGPNDYLMLTSFYETATSGGVNSFLCNLITDNPAGSLHECHFLQGSRGLGQIEGLTYQFVGRLAVRPLEVDHELNRVRLLRYEEDRNSDLQNVIFKPVTSLTEVFDGNYLVGIEYSLDFSTLFVNPDGLNLTYSISNPPSGLTLDPNTGLFSGTATEVSGLFNSVVTVSHRLGQTSTPVIFNVRPADAVGIAGHSHIPPMQIGTTFQVG